MEFGVYWKNVNGCSQWCMANCTCAVLHFAPLYKHTHERPLLMQYMGSALCDTTHKSTSPVASSAREKKGCHSKPTGNVHTQLQQW